MVHIIAGKKGKGKTKYLLDNANDAIKKSEGSIVYLDKSARHMHELDNKIRLVNITDYPIRSYNAFIGFICGIISSDYDLQEIYVDSFLKLSHLDGKDISEAVAELNTISEQNHIKIILSVSEDEANLPESVKDKIVVSL